MAKQKLSGIYCIEDAKGKMYYGSAVNLESRFAKHKSDLRNNKHRNPRLQNAWNKYGEQYFSFYVIEAVTDLSQLVIREQYWIDFLISTEVEYYNISPTAGSTLGKRHTEETKKKMSVIISSAMQSADLRKKLSELKKGKSLSLEHRQNIGLAIKGRSFSEETKIKQAMSRSKGKYYVFADREDIEYIIYNLRGFCRDYSLARSAIEDLIAGERKQYKGFRFVQIGHLEAVA